MEDLLAKFTNSVVMHFERKYQDANETQFIGTVYMPLNTAFHGVLCTSVGLIVSLLLFLVALNNKELMPSVLILFTVMAVFPALLTAYSFLMFSRCRMYYDSDGWTDTHVFKKDDRFLYSDIREIEYRNLDSRAFGKTLIVMHMKDGRMSCFSKRCYGADDFYKMLLAKAEQNRFAAKDTGGI